MLGNLIRNADLFFFVFVERELEKVDIRLYHLNDGSLSVASFIKQKFTIFNTKYLNKNKTKQNAFHLVKKSIKKRWKVFKSHTEMTFAELMKGLDVLMNYL